MRIKSAWLRRSMLIANIYGGILIFPLLLVSTVFLYGWLTSNTEFNLSYQLFVIAIYIPFFIFGLYLLSRSRRIKKLSDNPKAVAPILENMSKVLITLGILGVFLGVIPGLLLFILVFFISKAEGEINNGQQAIT